MTKGVRCAVAAAILFGASVPLSKGLLATIPPTTLAGLLYLGSGVGLALWRFVRTRGANSAAPAAREAALSRRDWPWLGAAIALGGIAAPILLLFGLRTTTASTGSLLLNMEGVLTALLAWFLFHEHFDRRIAIGMAAIVAGGILLSWSPGASTEKISWGAIAIVGACLGWAADNNLTRRVSAADPTEIAMWKGLVAGVVNLNLGLIVTPSPIQFSWLLAATVGFFSYGLSLAAFVLALRHLGTARTGAYFSTAPFVGVIFSLLFLGERPDAQFWIAAGLVGFGVWLHLTEQHEHEHTHEPMEHEHLHVHDAHHQHVHELDDPPGEPHSHPHRHEHLVHSHPHTPDLHHGHRHD